ncbi:alpha-2-macroglobulin [Lacinutrix sp. Hel_I_90]|uniref:alpha-2-macroglobulin family protein n=1 Tax=Lacinutrix sp. Hel_I_90 TaxID=1249999 RepID=UPI0005C8851C|nr:MG2 domain-containing protein [Lacinutrix sp. Hel_I_90]
MNKFVTVLILILFANTSFSQNNNYSKLWTEVEDLEIKGLPKSALKVVETIEAQANEENNAPQKIKALLFKSKYLLTLEEEAQLNIVKAFKAEIKNSAAPTKNVLENILATLYWQYFQQNRWKFYNRTTTKEKVDTEDFRTWDLQTVFEEVHFYYDRSLENASILQQTNLEAYSELLHEQKDSKIYRPTLYDFLAHNALLFYNTSENSITKPAYKFIIDDAKYLSKSETYAKLQIASKDTASLALNALKLYQELIRFHLKDKTPYALAAVNIDRLGYVKENTVIKNSEALLIDTYRLESERIASHEVSGLYDYEIAAIYTNQANNYSPEAPLELQWKNKEALALCDAVISKFPKSKAADKCKGLKAQISNPSLSILTESLLPVQTHGRLLVTHKNLDQVCLSAYKLTEKQHKTYAKIYRQTEREAFITKLNAIENWESALKNEKDYQFHRTEIIMPLLANGRYLIIGKTKDLEKNFLAFSTVQITNMAVVEYDYYDEKHLQIINRNNGKPIANAKVRLEFLYDHEVQETVNKTTDSRGKLVITKLKNNRRHVNIKITDNSEVAHFENLYINGYYSNRYPDTPESYNSFLFTDRSIYRPGQTVYFKGIAMKTKDEKSEVVANQKLTAYLYNVNGEKIKTLDLITNAYGSVAGEFILPNDGLTGSFSLRLQDNNRFNGYASISVEEYKRPKFETNFKPITESIRVNDSVTVKGEALAYAGASISNAKVVYRVKRNIQYPHWYYWRHPVTTDQGQEITQGETITDANGHYEVTFKAIPDETVDKESLPIFKYEITAEVTDINGETRSTTTIVNVGYHALLASISIPNNLDKTEKDHQITVDTKNLNGEFVPTKGSIKIYKLQAPENVLRPRPWPAGDYKKLTKAEFKKLFPHDAYDTESNQEQWEKGKLLFDEEFDTQESKTIDLGTIKKWPSGDYIVVIETKDQFGQLVKDEAKTRLYSAKEETLADKQLFSVTTNKQTYEINETVALIFGTAAKDLWVTVAIEKDHDIINTYVIQLNAEKKTIRIPITAKDLGGFVVHYSFAAYNSFQSSSIYINVPYPKTDLDIETVTFRDKLQPGTDETWSFKIKGPMGDKVSAELLASMYDASLDAFKPHSWQFNPIYHGTYRSALQKSAYRSFGQSHFSVQRDYILPNYYSPQSYDQLNWFGLSFGYGSHYYMKREKGKVSGIEINEEEAQLEEVAVEAMSVSAPTANTYDADEALKTEESTDVFSPDATEKVDFSTVKIRKNLQETAFFFPQLATDTSGNVSFSFTAPEALTKWKLQLLAHTKYLEHATTSLTTVTQKELMVLPNVPRFLRQGDQIKISTKISNLTDNPLAGVAVLQLFDALTGEPIDSKLSNTNNELAFTVDAKGNTQVTWGLNITDAVSAIQYKIIAKSGDFSDGEQNALPVLTNRMLVTETLAMWVKSNETRTFTLDKLETNTSKTLKNHKLTLEVTSNPAWYAVQALPYLMEYPYECNEQTFSSYYANALARHIANSNPRIQEVFNQWKNTDALVSDLEKNEELKSILIQETPWLRDAQSETEQKKRIALLFDLNKMNNELSKAKRKLENNQLASGGWSWFGDYSVNRYITQHIITGFGHLEKLGVSLSAGDDNSSAMVEKALNYLDSEFIKEYKDIRKFDEKADLTLDRLSYTQLHYLYMRSFFPEKKPSTEVKEIMSYYHSQIKNYWLKRNLYSKGMMALVAHRMHDNNTSANILKSLKETSITSDELGMYWKENTNSWYWYQAPIETQALMIEAFSEIENDTKTIDNLKIWLLKNKQTNSWKTTKATTEAVYALLLQGSDWLSVTEMVEVVIGGQEIAPSKLEAVKVEAGTGYYKTSWSGSEITPEMAEVKITKTGDGIAWGGLYWQYFEDLDKITSAETPLKLEKKLFKKTNTDKGEVITDITKDTELQVGDLIRVHIELQSDRNMEFVHMKDMRAAGLEPINVLSQYKYQDGLGYYEATKDASTNFFFDYLPKGIYVFEYDLRVNNAGNMSNGITTIQSMYAPEFSSHSEGTRITVE